MGHKWTTPEGEVLKAARATIFCKDPGDYRIRWTGPVCTVVSSNQFVTRERATLLAIQCGAGKVEQEYAT